MPGPARLLLCICALGCLLGRAWSYKFLVLPSTACTHADDLLAMGQALAAKGHTVTALLAESCTAHVPCAQHAQDVPAACMQVLRYEDSHSRLGNEEYLSHQAVKHDSVAAQFSRETTAALAACAVLLSNTALVKQLSDDKFDMAIMDLGDACSWPLTDALLLPRIDYDASGSAGLQMLKYGLSLPLAYVAAMGSGLSGGYMTFSERLRNVLHHAQVLWAYRSEVRPRLDAFRLRMRGKAPNVYALPRRRDPRLGTVLCLASGDWSIQEPVPVPPLIKYIGPMLPVDSSAAQLPPELQSFLSWHDGQDKLPPNGQPAVVAVWFGDGYRMPARAVAALGEAFVDLSLRVVWRLGKVDQSRLRSIYSPVTNARNVHIAEDIPIGALLSHPNVVCLVTEASMPHVSIALWFGVPVLGVALSLEHADVLARVERLGIGRELSRTHLERGLSFMVEHEVARTAGSTAMSKRAAAVSQRLRALRPQPLDAAVMWAEYAVEAGAAPFLHTMDLYLPWWKVAILDLWAAGLGSVAVVLFVLVLLLRAATCKPTRGKAPAGAPKPKAE